MPKKYDPYKGYDEEPEEDDDGSIPTRPYRGQSVSGHACAKADEEQSWDDGDPQSSRMKDDD